MSKYTESERVFLAEARPIFETRGTRTRVVAELRAIVDIRTLGASEAMYEKLLDQRASKIPKQLAEFRSGKSAVATAKKETATVTTAPEVEQFGTKLWQ